MLTVTTDRNRISAHFKGTVTVISDVPIMAYEARATKSGEPWGRGIGHDLLSDDAVSVNGVVALSAAVKTFSFDIEAEELSSDGDYRISVYVMDPSGIWNDCCNLFTNASQAVIDKNGAAVLAKRNGTGTDESYTSAYSGTEIDNFISEVLQ